MLSTLQPSAGWPKRAASHCLAPLWCDSAWAAVVGLLLTWVVLPPGHCQ